MAASWSTQPAARQAMKVGSGSIAERHLSKPLNFRPQIAVANILIFATPSPRNVEKVI
jgi:hypothetical protein